MYTVLYSKFAQYEYTKYTVLYIFSWNDSPKKSLIDRDKTMQSSINKPVTSI